MGHNLMQRYRLKEEWVRRCLAERDLGVLVEGDSVCQVAKKPYGILASMIKEVLVLSTGEAIP